MKTSLAILLTIFALSEASKLLQILKLCRLSDPEYSKCLDETINSFIASLGQSSEILNLTTIDPLAIPKINSGQTDSPVSLKQVYENIQFYGLTKGMRMSKSRIDFDNLVFTAESWNPRLDFVADYEAEGQVLFLPVRGKGKSNVTMIKNTGEHTIQFEKFVRDDETYLKAVKYDIKFKPEKVILQFDHILDDYKAVGEAVQSLLNENADFIFQELKGPYEVAFGVVFKDLIVNKIFTNYPMKTLFPEK